MARHAFAAVVLLAAGFASAAEKELHVVALGRGSFDDNRRPRKAETFLYIINPKSGKVQLAWKE